jgi:hypothetical protein
MRIQRKDRLLMQLRGLSGHTEKYTGSEVVVGKEEMVVAVRAKTCVNKHPVACCTQVLSLFLQCAPVAVLSFLSVSLVSKLLLSVTKTFPSDLLPALDAFVAAIFQ